MSTPVPGKGAIGTIFLTTFIDLLGVGIIIPIVAPLLINTNLIIPEGAPEWMRNYSYGAIVALFPLFSFFSSPFLGSLSDKLGRKPVLFGSLFVTVAAYGLSALAIYSHSLWMLFAGRALLGIAAGNLAVVFSSIADLSDPAAKAKNFGLVGMAFGFGFIIGPVLGGLLSDEKLVSWFSLATPFVFAALLAVLNLFMVLTRFPETLREKRDVNVSAFTGIRNIGLAFTNPALRPVLLVVFLFVFGFTFFTQFFQILMMKKFKVDQQGIGYIFGYVGVLLAFTQGGLVRILGKKFVPRAILRVSLLLASLGYLVILQPDTLPMMYVAIMVIPFTQGMTSPNLSALVSNAAPANMQGEVLGIQSSVQSLAQFVPAVIGGYLMAFSPEIPMYVAAVSTGLAWLVLMYDSRGKIS